MGWADRAHTIWLRKLSIALEKEEGSLTVLTDSIVVI